MPRRPAARPQCEPLEPREVLSASGPGWGPPPDAAVVQQALARAAAIARSFPPLTSELQVDLDGDGELDQVRLDRAEGGSTVLCITRTGAGATPSEASLTFPEACEGLFYGDLDGDSQPDLFIRGAGPGLGALLLGRGDGTFAVSREVAAQVALAVADLDGDLLDDFVLVDSGAGQVLVELTTRGREVVAKRGDGPLAFGASVLADLNGDKVLDLAVCDPAAGRLLIYPGQGDGRFGAELHGGAGLPVAPGLTHVAAGRLHERGRFTDLVVVSELTGTLSVVSGAEGFVLKVETTFSVGTAPSAALVEDVTGDGLADLVVTSRSADRAWVVPGRGEGTFDLAGVRTLITGPRPAGAVTGDFDGDSRCDLVTLDSGGDSLSFFSDVGSAGTTRRVISAGVVGPSTAVVRDVNGDGMSDLFVGGAGDGSLALLLGSSDGPTHSQTQAMPGPGAVALAASSVSVGSAGVYALVEGSDAVAWVGFEAKPTGAGGPVHPATEGVAPFAGEEAALGAAVDLRPLGPALFGLVPVLVTAGHEWSAEPACGGRPDLDATGAFDVGSCRLVCARAGDEAAPVDAPLTPRPEGLGAVERFLLGADDVPPPPLTAEGQSEAAQPPVGAPPPTPAQNGAPEPPPEAIPLVANVPLPEERRGVDDELLASALMALALAGRLKRRRGDRPCPG